MLKLGRHVDFRNAVFDRLAHLVERSSRAAVEHERNVGKPFGDGPAAVDVKFRFALVIAVGGPDGDGERIDSGGGGESGGFVGVGQRGFVAHGDVADFAFDGGSGGAGEFGAAAGEADIFLLRKYGSRETSNMTEV